MTNYDITSALASSPASIDRGAQLFKGLTVAELLLIIAMCSVEKKTGSSGSYNFHMAYGELLSLFSLEDDFEIQLKGISRVDSLEKILAKGNLLLDNETKLSLMHKKNEEYLESISGLKQEDLLPGVLDFLKECKFNGIKI